MMTLKSIELLGFKSFGKKSAVSFNTPITAIVGPNGSGKSNIVEAIRFVLGEQSMKSLRGKGGVDLIFKGSKGLSSSNRAMVTITFDNSKKIFSFTNSGIGVSLDYDEVSISREVFPDGVNKYSINGTEVRLKDIIDLLASVNIGSSGHHIISQGEADRVLNASNKDRRFMIEDALGLKIYQYRIRESERKLEKTILNMKEVTSLRKELAPHLAFLKKQVQALEKAKEMREDLKSLYRVYLSLESSYINNEEKRLAHEKHLQQEKMLAIEERISLLNDNKRETTESIYLKDIKIKENELFDLRRGKDELTRSLGKIEGILESLDRQIKIKKEVKEKVIPESRLREMLIDIEKNIDEALSSSSLDFVSGILRNIKNNLNNFYERNKNEPEIVDNQLKSEYQEIEKSKEDILFKLKESEDQERNILDKINELKIKEQENQSALLDSERVLYELLGQKNSIVSSMHSLDFGEEKLSMIKNSFEVELTEASVLIGREVIDFAKTPFEGEINRASQEELRRKIERIKIKLEDSGLGSGADVMKEYEDTRERDEFLAKELIDLNKSIDDCRLLIQDLKETLDIEFKNGVNKINKQFQEFFSLMFGGGSAFLSIVMEHKKIRKNEDKEEGENEEGSEDEELGFERGIEVNVTLPQKKVKDLHMLSGGERSLTSIALLFAISQVNPPPFLVLDETDAALDEANSRKYGNMLENLSRYSQLVVVTHNRETMSRAQVLFGVTMGAEGASKLLSIHLEDASVYAK